MSPYTKAFFVLIIPLILITCNFSPVIAQDQSLVPGEYIIHFDDEHSAQSFFNDQITKNEVVQAFYSERLMGEPMNLWLVVFDVYSKNTAKILNSWSSDKRLRTIQQNRYIYERKKPDDPDYNKQWQYNNDGTGGGVLGADLEIEKAWEITTGGITALGDTIVICVIDSGINGEHEDIKPNLWTNKKEIPGNGIDDDQNGYVDDYYGWNATESNDNVYNNSTHGTSVAGIVGAKGNNGKGVSGVNWDVKLMIVTYGRPTEANALAAYAYPYTLRKRYNDTNGAEGAYVVATNASWGLNMIKAEDAPIWCNIFDILGQVGILNCGATANEGVDVDEVGDLPTTCESEFLISVTNLTRADIKRNDAGFGSKSIDLGAYGHQAYTTTSNGYGVFSGTSSASPHVAGTIGLLYSTDCPLLAEISKTNPSTAALIAKDMILHGVVSNSSLQNITTTGGRLNTFNAVDNIHQLCSECSAPAGIELANHNDNIKVSWANDQGNAQINLRYRPAGEQNWIEVNNIQNGHFISKLEYCTEYEIQLGSSCGIPSSEFSYSKYFVTSRCCEKPTALSVTVSDKTLNLNWNKPQFYDEFLVEYKTFNGEWIQIYTDSNHVSITNTEDCLLYKFRVRNECTNFNTLSDFTNEISQSTLCGSCSENIYCDVFRNDSSQEWIEKIRIGDQTHTSGRDKTGYGKFIGTTLFSLSKDKKDTLEIVPGYAGQRFKEYYKAFIDFNQNGVWENNELVFESIISTSESVKALISIPSDALNGISRMRIFMTYDSFPGGCDHPEFEFGEVEDYCIHITDEECSKITKSELISTTQNKANLLVSLTTGTSDSLQITYSKIPDNIFINKIFYETNLTLESLDSCTTYKYEIRSFCEGVPKLFESQETFKTACSTFTDDYNINANFIIYPNPFSDLITISFYNIPSVRPLFNLFSVDGKQLPIKSDNTSELQLSYTIQTDANISPGLYVLRIGTESGFYNIKIVKY